MGLAGQILSVIPASTNHLQLKVRQVTILTQEVSMGIDFLWREKVIVFHSQCGNAITKSRPIGSTGISNT